MASVLQLRSSLYLFKLAEDIGTHIDNSRAETAQGRSQLAQASNTHKDQNSSLVNKKTL